MIKVEIEYMREDGIGCGTDNATFDTAADFYKWFEIAYPNAERSPYHLNDWYDEEENCTISVCED